MTGAARLRYVWARSISIAPPRLHRRGLRAVGRARLDAAGHRRACWRRRAWRAAARRSRARTPAWRSASVAADEAELLTLAVRPAHRRRGAGRRLCWPAIIDWVARPVPERCFSRSVPTIRRRTSSIRTPGLPRSAAGRPITGAAGGPPADGVVDASRSQRSSERVMNGRPDGHDMDIALPVDPQDGVALVAGSAADVAQRLLAAQADPQDLARLQALQAAAWCARRSWGRPRPVMSMVMVEAGRLVDMSPTIPRTPASVGCTVVMPDRKSKLELLCVERGLKMTDQRRVIARVCRSPRDHPDVEAVHRRATAIDANISIATVYRTVRLFEEAGDSRQARFRRWPRAL